MACETLANFLVIILFNLLSATICEPTTSFVGGFRPYLHTNWFIIDKNGAKNLQKIIFGKNESARVKT